MSSMKYLKNNIYNLYYFAIEGFDRKVKYKKQPDINKKLASKGVIQK